MMLQYNGAVRLNTNPCDTPGCKSGKGRELRVAYAFPSWLTRRAVQFSAYWGSLTDMGASLHLHVPTVCQSMSGLLDILYKEDIAELRERITNRDLLPTDVNEDGWDFLLFCLRRQSFQSASFLLDVGFNPSNQEPKTGWSAKQFARHLLLEDKLSLGYLFDELSFQTCVKIAGDIEEQPEASTLIRDAILGIGSITLEDALALEGCRVNELDDGGYSPLHWAITLDNMDQVRLLLEHGADIELRNRYHHQTPLRHAVLGSHQQIVAFLLSKGASTAAQEINGCGMLHPCTDPEVVRMLLEANADPNDARNLSKYTPLHYLVAEYTTASWPEEKRCNIALQLLRAGCDLEARSSGGMTALLLAVCSGLQKVTRFLHRQGGRLDAIDNACRNILHYTVLTMNKSMIDYFRSLEIEGMDPDCGDTSGGTALAYFESRMRHPGIVDIRQTQRSVFSYYALISEIRCRNWELGMFLERKQQLERHGHLENTRRWFGWQWQMMHDTPEFADLRWDTRYDVFPETFFREELYVDIDYNTDLLFGRADEVDRKSAFGGPPGMSREGREDDADEFFDAME
ncbi:Ankyrin repeat-containing domain protein [Rhypophila sp. PSN 637]